jgi:hypothetical protein
VELGLWPGFPDPWSLVWFVLFFFFFQSWGLNSGSCLWGRCSTTWVTPPAQFCISYFQDRVYHTICLQCLWTMILLMSALWVARITGVSHWNQAGLSLLSYWNTSSTVHLPICQNPVLDSVWVFWILHFSFNNISYIVCIFRNIGYLLLL